MVSLLLLRRVWRTSTVPSIFLYRGRFYSTGLKHSKPLRILFCGSDDFSVASLKALHAESQENPWLIKSIDVLCRPPKRTGRGMKNLQHVPLFHAAKDLQLQIHQKDTFLGWDLPMPNGEPINLIIAVSFGLFVPPRLIRAAEYGGLNVHPSMLPNHRGSAPLQRLIMYGARNTGITLQTLDDKKFDHGIILAQKRVRIPQPDSITYPELLDYMTPQAAELLVNGLKTRVYVAPLIDVSKDTWESSLSLEELTHAPKISKEDRHINWHRNDALTRITRRYRALGPMWSMLYVDKEQERRFVFHDFEVVEKPAAVKDMAWKWKTGHWFMNNEKSKTGEDASEEQQSNDDGSPSPPLTISEDEARNEENLFHAWNAFGEGNLAVNSDAAFASWLAFREKALASGEIQKPSKHTVYYMIDTSSSGDLVPVFYVEDGTAIIVAVKGAGLRIKDITVEGDKKKHAAAAMKMYRKVGMWRLQYREEDGVDRWFANYNPSYSRDMNRDKWLETLSPERREEEEDKRMWFEIREEKRRERAVWGSPQLINKVKYMGIKQRAEDLKLRMKKARDEVNEQKRLKRREAENLERERMRIKEDMKKHDWSDLLLEGHADFFPEVAKEARLERLREREENHRKVVEEMKNAKEGHVGVGEKLKDSQQESGKENNQVEGDIK